MESCLNNTCKNGLSKTNVAMVNRSPTKTIIKAHSESTRLPNSTFEIKKTTVKMNPKYYQRSIAVEIATKLPKVKEVTFANEERELYRQHRNRLANIKGKVDTHLPPPKAKKVELNHMELSYMEMLTALYRKSNNTLRTFTKSPERLASGRWRNAHLARQKDRRQQELRKALYKSESVIDSFSKRKFNDAFSYEIPMHVLHRYESLMSKCDVGMLCKLLRPQIYFDVEVRGSRIQGRLVIQLFTEACPEVVLEFIRICTLQEKHRISFTKIFVPIWLEGRIMLDPKRNIDMSNIEHDFEVLNHGVDAGILSFPSRYIRGNARGTINFTISFKPLSILNGKRIAFGKIRKGLSLLERVQEYTSHLANLNNVIIVTGCGTL